MELTQFLNRDILLRNGIRGLSLLGEWLRVEPTLSSSLGALVLLYALKRVRFLFDPFEEVRSLPLWTLSFLPCLSYAAVLEVEKELRCQVPAADDKKVCTNIALGYLLGDMHFYRLLSLSLRDLIRFGLAYPNCSKTHGGLPSHACKLAEGGKGVQPLQYSLFPDVGV